MPDLETRTHDGGATELEPRTASGEPSVAELIAQVSNQTSRLVRDEVKLAKTELSATVKHAGVGVGLFGGAGVFALLALGTLVATAVLALALVLAPWLAALIVAVVLFVLAAVVALVGKKQVASATPPAPERAIDNVKKDVQQVKEGAAHGNS